MAWPAGLPDPDAWDAWHPAEAAQILAGVEAPWYVAAGWAIDLFAGGEPREHEDLEIAVPRDRFDEVAAALGDYELYAVGPKTAVPVAEAGGLLDRYHQTWMLDRHAGCWRLDVFREPCDGDTWLCRRDETIRMPAAEVIERTSDGIPYGRPEIVLLFKAKHARGKDERDLERSLPLLDPGRRRWLRESLELCHPGHRWLERV